MRGFVEKRITASGKLRWDARFREGGRDAKEQSRTFKTKEAADNFLNGTTKDVADRTYQRVTPIPLRDLFSKYHDWLAVAETLGQIRKSTRRAYCSAINLHLIPAFGEIESDQLMTEQVDAWQQDCAKKIAAGTIAAKSYNNHVGCLSAALAWGRTRKYLAHQPLPRGMRSRKKGKPRQIVVGLDIDALWNACATEQDLVIVAIALFCGLRRGEIFGLRWTDLVWPSGTALGTLTVERAFVQRELVDPKTEAGKRVVELPTRLSKLLRSHFKHRPPQRAEDGFAYIVRQDSGALLDPDNWATEVWPTIRTAAGLHPGVTMHSLRHSFASLLLAKKIPVKYVSEKLGHTTPGFTMQQYQHLLPTTNAEAARVLDAAVPQTRGKGKRPKLRLVKGA